MLCNRDFELPQRLPMTVEIFVRGVVGGYVRIDCAEPTYLRRSLRPRNGEGQVDDVAADGREQPLWAEGLEDPAVRRVDIAEAHGSVRRIVAVRTDLQANPRRCKQGAAGTWVGGGVEEIARQEVRRR